ncbi:MAG TPA: flagellar basal body rod protein FlgC [Candidatus Marinimicrobia bacterium]|nr:flagellar basal body rod protein FlgC [Candidatus Neomarinimicrobiota bacterium]
MEVRGIFSTLRTTLTGMSAQMKRMNIISENIANAEKMPDENGNIYKRKVVVQNSVNAGPSGSFGDQMRLRLRRSNGAHFGNSSKDYSFSGKPNTDTIEVKEINDIKTVFDPGHPLADIDGFVKMPNVNMIEEMVDMVAASRNYEANVSVMTAAKNMAKKAMEI